MISAREENAKAAYREDSNHILKIIGLSSSVLKLVIYYSYKIFQLSTNKVCADFLTFDNHEAHKLLKKLLHTDAFSYEKIR